MKRDSPFSLLCCLYNVFALRRLDEFAFMKWKKGSNINYLLSCFENPFSKMLLF